MKLYIDNCSERINCNELIKEIQTHNVDPSHGHLKLKKSDPCYNEYKEQTENLLKAGYDNKSVEYRHYKPGEHFNEEYVKILGDITNSNPLMCWVSEIRPGKCIPWHWDINPLEEEFKKKGNLVRYICFLSKPEPGHLFLTKDDIFYNDPQGAIYQYPDLQIWHCGVNLGFNPKFLLTLTSYQ